LADAARTAALEVLRAVRSADAYTNLALPAALRRHGLSGRDAAFATELASGTVRRQGLYDAVLAACVDRPLAKVQARVLDALRLGVHQLLAMRVPAHAAISTTVALVRSDVGPGAAGFANAVLRRASEHDLEGWIARVAPTREHDLVGHLSVAHAHPRWVVEALTAAVGGDEIEALLAADNEAPGVTLVARPGRSTRDELPGEPTPYSPYGVHLAAGDPGAVAAVAEGRAGVQDEGSQLVALALASAPLDGPDERWLDLCAGPGGKAALLAALAEERGASVLASELQPHRAGLVRRALKGAGGVLGVVAADGTRPPWSPGSFDRVLVDAPCTGLGALRRRPEARWRRQVSDLDALVPLQKALLSSALDSLRPGGVVLYATCSPVLAETAEVVSAVLAARSDTVLDDAAPLLPDALLVQGDCAGPHPGTFQLWPHRHHTDAMFGALLRRVAG
jgi:16S rRNA (cytosine967-C5)-methyltransferase